jgi:hypothetical protein
MGSGLDDLIYWHFFTITINYNISQMMTVSDLLHSLLDYKCLLFRWDWIGSDLRICHFFYCNHLEWRLSFECQMTELSWTKLTSRWPKYRSPPQTVFVILFSCFHKMCLSNRCPAMDYFVSICCSGNVCLASRWLAMDFCSGSTIPAFGCHVTIFIIQK